jgi:hypothetical protein
MIAMTQPASQPPELYNQLAEVVIKVLEPGGVSIGGLYGLWAWLVQDEVATAIASALIGFCFSYAAKLLEPIHQGNQRRLAGMGQAAETAIDENLQRLLAKATKAEDAYLLCQALDCRDYKPEGMGARDRTFIPMLHSVFVPLELDVGAIAPGLQKFHLQRLKATGELPELYVWDLLKQAQHEPTYRQLAIVAWGGFGKTTLLKHLAYVFGSQQHRDYDVPFWVPFLLPLRAYRKVFAGTPNLSLPDLIMHYHVESLAELNPKLHNLPGRWAEDLLIQGKALVMFDGFDEVPEAERHTLSRWIHRQMRRFDRTVFILASRPKAYTESFTEPLRTKIWVRPFNAQQQTQFVQQWYASQERLARGGLDSPEVEREAKRSAQNLLSQIHNPQRPELADLAKNPLLLNLLVTYHRSNPSVELPRQRAELYQDIVTLQLRKRPEARDVELLLTPADRQKVLQFVALEMMQAPLRLIPEADLIALTATALQKQGHTLSAATFINQMIDVSELIVRQGLEGCEFAHLSFQEFLAAAQVKDLQQESLLYPHLQNANADSDDEDRAWWRQTILLYAAQITNPTSLIKEALRQKAVDLAYACYQETQRTLDKELAAELEALKPQIQTSRYAKLEELLKAQQWREADQETYRLMITTVGKEEGQWFDPEDLKNFPCEDLKAIDELWLQYSEGDYGFSVQMQSYLECGAKLHSKHSNVNACTELIDLLGWENTTNSEDAPPNPKNLSLNSIHGKFPHWQWKISLQKWKKAKKRFFFILWKAKILLSCGI